MSVWRNFLSAVLPWVFKSAEAAADAAVKKGDPAKAAAEAVSGLSNDSKVLSATEEVIVETVKKAKK